MEYFYCSFYSLTLVKLMFSNAVIEAIKSRRSIRSFEEKTIPESTIQTLLEAGTYAPTAVNAQPWKFTIITDKDFMKNLSNMAKPALARMLPDTGDEMTISLKKRLTSPETNLFYNAPLLIVVAGTKSPYAVTDCSLAAQNMMLAAYSLGIGSCFIGALMVITSDPKVKTELGVPEDHDIYAAMIFGYPKETPKAAPPRQKPQILKQIS
jgi:nitroreductase